MVISPPCTNPLGFCVVVNRNSGRCLSWVPFSGDFLWDPDRGATTCSPRAGIWRMDLSFTQLCQQPFCSKGHLSLKLPLSFTFPAWLVYIFPLACRWSEDVVFFTWRPTWSFTFSIFYLGHGIFTSAQRGENEIVVSKSFHFVPSGMQINTN